MEKYSQPSTWELTSDGALVRSQHTAPSVLGTSYSNYTVEFSTKIAHGGFVFGVSSQIFPNGSVIVINSEDGASTFANTNSTRVPRNTLVYNYGYTIQKTTNGNPPDTYYPVPFPVLEDVWYRVRCVMTPSGYENSMNGTSITLVTFNQADGPKLSGTWRFGAVQDQTAYFKDVVVTSQNGTILYSNDMRCPDILDEYGNTNDYSVFRFV